MSKKHQKSAPRKSTRQLELEQDHDVIDTCAICNSPRVPCNCDPEEQIRLRAPSYQPVKAPKHDFKEGQVVVVPNKAHVGNDGQEKAGTIILICGGDVHVLDEKGLIHSAKISELYRPQN